MRPSTACLTCRQGKRKCRQRPGEYACARCQTHRLRCSFEPHCTSSNVSRLPKPAPALITVLTPGIDESSVLTPISPSENLQQPELGQGIETLGPLSVDNALDLVDLNACHVREMVKWYFKVIHDKHHSLFHQPSFERDLERDLIPKVIIYSIVALGARFADSIFTNLEGRRERGKHFAHHAFQLVDLRDVSLANVQACVLLATLCFTEGNTKSEAVYYATANRMAMVLDLPNHQAPSELERQINLRVWWSLYMIDIWSSSGLRLPRQFHYDESIPLPAEETYFLQSATASILPPPARGTGIWAEMARLGRIWSEIQEMNRSSVEGHLGPIQLHSAVEGLVKKLEGWRASLPSFLVNTPPNRAHYMASNLGTSFAALHLGYHYYSEVLLYQFMAAATQRNGFSVLPAQAYSDRCAQHAMAFCDILYECDAATHGQECLYIMLGHMLVVTSTVYVHMLLFNDTPSAIPPDVLRDRLQHNFSILTRLQLFWRTLESSLSRLKVFHNACLRSIEGSFDMDRWMLRFILEYGVNMPEKFAGEQECGLHEVNAELGESSTSLRQWYSETFTAFGKN